MKKILLLAILFLMITPIFAQRSRSNYGRGRSRRIESKETDPNSWKNDLPVLPKKINEEQPKRKKTLEDRVKELEYQVEKLERMISSLRQDNRILEKRFQDYKISNSEEAKARKKEAERKEKMTREEQDRAMGYYPYFPEIVYGPKKNSDEYNKGYTDGYNAAFEYDEVDNWVYNEVDSEVDNEPNIKEK